MKISMDTSLNMNLNQKVVVSNSTLPEVTSQQQEAESPLNGIAVHMTISQKGMQLVEGMVPGDIPQVEEAEMMPSPAKPLSEEEQKKQEEITNQALKELERISAKAQGMSKPEDSKVQEEIEKIM